MNKNNVKVVLTLLKIIIAKNDSFDFTCHQDKLKNAIEKNISHSKKIIREKIKELLKICVSAIGPAFLK